jgi:uncharacterized protein (DUF1499 family)
MDFLLLVFTLAVLNGGNPDGWTHTQVPVPEHLADCPLKPNCVSSEARNAEHAVAPLQLNGDPAAAWEAMGAVVSQLPRATVVQSTADYLHVTIKSRLFGFVDDLELLRDAETGRVAIRSASRTGYSDLGVNRRRLENLRSKLRQAAIIH